MGGWITFALMIVAAVVMMVYDHKRSMKKIAEHQRKHERMLARLAAEKERFEKVMNMPTTTFIDPATIKSIKKKPRSKAKNPPHGFMKRKPKHDWLD